MLPVNMPLALGTCTYSGEYEAVEKVFKNNGSLEENILTLTRYWKMRFWFKSPVLIKTRKTKIRLPDEGVYKCWSIRHQVTTTDHVFNYFFKPDKWNYICYTLARNGTEGYKFPTDQVEKYELILKRR